jgi:hypothetical protein
MSSVKGDDGAPSGFQPNGPFGVWGDSGESGPGTGTGVIGSSAGGSGVAGFSLARSHSAAGVFGGGPHVGVAGAVNGAITAPLVSTGVYGTGSNGKGLGGVGVYGESDTNNGVVGFSNESSGVFGISPEIGVMGLGGWIAGYFFGAVHITGDLFKAGGGFRIDHPLDPANKYLQHSFVESPQRKNVYDGISTCGPGGEVIVELPHWFDTLNSDCCYQLTPIGRAAPNLFIAAEVKDNRFKIGGGSAGLKVSWQITGIRQDAWAKAHRLVPEEDKTGPDRGRYLHPEEHGQSREHAIGHAHLARAQEHLDRSERKRK